jgi:hypothetical protein
VVRQVPEPAQVVAAVRAVKTLLAEISEELLSLDRDDIEV